MNSFHTKKLPLLHYCLVYNWYHSMPHKIFVGTSFYIHIKKSYRAVKFGYKVIIMIERSTMCGKHVSFWLVRQCICGERQLKLANDSVVLKALRDHYLEYPNEFGCSTFLANNCRIVLKYLNNTFLMLLKTRHYCPLFRFR